MEIRRNVRGEWNVVPSQRNRRITAATPMRIAGPARGHELLRTRHSPDGTRTRGTHNNCSNGFTPGAPTSPARRTGSAISPPRTANCRAN
ncbi:DUF839 domain-containing protein [Pseudomonas aeruginosa]|nr:DUF839 domain-containing protein [Pseudomonas aeruginosa]